MDPAIERKLAREKKLKKLRSKVKMKKAPRNIDDLAEGFDETGTFLAKKGDTVVMRRDHRADKQVSLCTVLVANTAYVHLYDETLGQQFLFGLDGPKPTIKLMLMKSAGETVLPEEIADDIPVYEERSSGDILGDKASNTDDVAEAIEGCTTGVPEPDVSVDVEQLDVIDKGTVHDPGVADDSGAVRPPETGGVTDNVDDIAVPDVLS